MISLLLGNSAHAADPGQSFWSLNVGNFWTYSGNSGAFTYTEEVQSKGTAPCSATQYKVEGLKDGGAWETTCLETTQTELKLCRLEFYYAGQWIQLVPFNPGQCVRILLNPITGDWTDIISVTVSIGAFTRPGALLLNSHITVVGQEDVVTPMGTFYAHKVHAVQSVFIPATPPFIPSDMTVTKDEFGWFVPYIGIVKAEEGGDSEVVTSLNVKREITDLDMDGRSDLVGLTSGGEIFYSTDHSTWAQVPGFLNSLVVGDFDGNGSSDLAGLTSGGSIFYSINLSNWTRIPGVLNSAVAGDFNGDGSSDLAGLASDGTIWFTTNLSTFTQIPGFLDSLVVGDFNSDGNADLAGLASDGTIWFTTNLSTFTQIPGSLDSLVVGDFNGDGNADLAGLTSGGSVFYTLDGISWSQIPGVLNSLVTGDLNGDGTADLAGLTSGGSIFYTTNAITWTQIPGALASLVAGDFNSNGSSDLAGLTAGGGIFYTVDGSSWTQIPGVLSELAQ
jgi:hypothetical protein